METNPQEPNDGEPGRSALRNAIRRALLACGAAVVACLLVEGAVSIARGRGILGALRTDPLENWAAALARDADRFAAAAKLPGVYQAHSDPFVRYTCRASATFDIRDASVRTDDLGMRSRGEGATDPDGALRIAVVGDSIAFGYGLKDTQTLAAALERQLNAASSSARKVACFTVASPGWNQRQETRFVSDHLDTLRPDIVLCIPISNDLYDADSVSESGYRFMAPDPAQRDPLLMCNAAAPTYLVLGLAAQRRRVLGIESGGARIGPEAMTADLSPESHRRYAANADSLRELEQRLEPRGARLFVLRYEDDDYSAILRAETTRRGMKAPWIPLFTKISPSFTLVDDSHPNARTVEAMATLVARRLGKDILPDGFDPTRLPALASEFAAADASQASDDALARIEARAEQARSQVSAQLEPIFDTTSAQGANQVYGGINADGSLGLAAKLVLKRAGTRIRVQLQPLHARPDLYPLDVKIVVDGSEVGSMRVGEGATDEVSFEAPLPAVPGSPPAVEIGLVPSRYGITRPFNAALISAARVVHVEVL